MTDVRLNLIDSIFVSPCPGVPSYPFFKTEKHRAFLLSLRKRRFFFSLEDASSSGLFANARRKRAVSNRWSSSYIKSTLHCLFVCVCFSIWTLSFFYMDLPQNIAHSIESGTFLKVSSVVLYIFPPTFNLIILPTWTSESRVFDNCSEADFSGLRLPRPWLMSSQASSISLCASVNFELAESNKPSRSSSWADILTHITPAIKVRKWDHVLLLKKPSSTSCNFSVVSMIVLQLISWWSLQ